MPWNYTINSQQTAEFRSIDIPFFSNLYRRLCNYGRAILSTYFLVSGVSAEELPPTALSRACSVFVKHVFRDDLIFLR